jgi:hypothetical protein
VQIGPQFLTAQSGANESFFGEEYVAERDAFGCGAPIQTDPVENRRVFGSYRRLVVRVVVASLQSLHALHAMRAMHALHAMHALRPNLGGCNDAMMQRLDPFLRVDGDSRRALATPLSR